MDNGDFSGVLDLTDDLGDIADIAVQHKYGLDVGVQTLRQPIVVAHGGNDRVALQGFIKSLFQAQLRLSPNSGSSYVQKRAQQTDGTISPLVTMLNTPGVFCC